MYGMFSPVVLTSDSKDNLDLTVYGHGWYIVNFWPRVLTSECNDKISSWCMDMDGMILPYMLTSECNDNLNLTVYKDNLNLTVYGHVWYVLTCGFNLR